MAAVVTVRFSDEDYRRLFALRHGLRRFLRWSEDQATRAGVTPAQHQLLLAIRGLGARPGPTVGDLAEALLLRHHSTVELIDRAEEAGLVRRRRDPADARVVRLLLTDRGRGRLETLTAVHVEELSRLSRSLRPMLDGLEAPEAVKPAPI